MLVPKHSHWNNDIAHPMMGTINHTHSPQFPTPLHTTSGVRLSYTMCSLTQI